MLAASSSVAAALRALAVNDGGAGLVVFLTADPHLREGGGGGQDGASGPGGEPPLCRSDHLKEERTDVKTAAAAREVSTETQPSRCRRKLDLRKKKEV